MFINKLYFSYYSNSLYLRLLDQKHFDYSLIVYIDNFIEVAVHIVAYFQKSYDLNNS